MVFLFGMFGKCMVLLFKMYGFECMLAHFHLASLGSICASFCNYGVQQKINNSASHCIYEVTISSIIELQSTTATTSTT